MRERPMSYVVPGVPDPRSTHRHTSRCYWDLTECSWVCRSAVTAPLAGGGAPGEGSPSVPAPSPLPR
jgi:hypothetical protein